MPGTARLLVGATDQRHESHVVTVSGNDTAADVALASLHAMGSGTLTDFEGFYTADAVNREARNEPPDTRGTGPAALYATARWLRTAFSDLAWRVHDVAHDDDLVVVHATMSGRQTGPWSEPASSTRPVVLVAGHTLTLFFLDARLDDAGPVVVVAAFGLGGLLTLAGS